MDEKEVRIRLDASTVHAFEELAATFGKPLDYMIQTALEKYLRDCEENQE